MTGIRIPKRVEQMSPPQIDVVKTRIAYWRARGENVIGLGQAVPGFPPPPVALERARAALANPETHVYSADAGLLELRRALCRRLRESFQVHADPESEVIITAGANQAFMLALFTLLEPGDEVLLPSPFFMNHKMAVESLGAIPVEAPLRPENGFTLELEAVEPYLSRRTRAAVVVSPSNPTGAVVEPSELRRLAEGLAGRGIAVIGDETYMHFVYDGARHASLAAFADLRQNLLVVGSLSKSFAMTGWRIGFLIAAPRVIEQALKLQDTMVICAPVIGQYAALAAVQEAWDYARSFLPEFDARRRYLEGRLRSIPVLQWEPTRGGFFALARVRGCTDAQALSMELLDRAHVATIPGHLFGQAGQGCLRISYGAVDMPALEQACDRLARFFAEWEPESP